MPIKECDAQRGSEQHHPHRLERYKQVATEKKLDNEKRMAETQRASNRATSLETPLLERT